MKVSFDGRSAELVKAKYDYVKYGRSHPMFLEAAMYGENRNLAIKMYSNDAGYMEPWSTLTVNLSVKLPPDCAYIDTNNNGDEVIDWIIKNKLGTPTGEVRRSGYCVYPMVKFDLNKFE